MCLYPRLIRNPRLRTSNSITITDKRQMLVAIGCGQCYECRKQKAQSWRVRLTEELKSQKYAYFITLTFSEESLNTIKNSISNNTPCIENSIAAYAVRHFLERWRKKYKKSLRHWLITELGQTNTERLHLHGIIFTETPEQVNELENIWSYGFTDIGEYCNQRTINYIIKYVTKIDKTHKDYKSEIFASNGIGSSWLDTFTAKHIKYKGINTQEFYMLPNGRKVALPIYYRNKLFTEKERMQLWSNRLDKDRLFVNGIEIDNVSKNYETYCRTLRTQQEWNRKIGYGVPENKWDKSKYEEQFYIINARTHV